MIHKKKCVFAITILSLCCLALTGCDDRADVKNAYSLYETTDSYSTETAAKAANASLLAEDLCVGGTTNTDSDSVNADSAESAAVFSVANEEITYAKNIYDRHYPASTTKIMTAYLALKYGDPDQILTVSQEAIDALDSGSSLCGLNVGDQISLEQALYGLMLCSGNDAANVIAESISGSMDAFVELMNQEALSLGATQTHFANPSGLPDENHYTTAYDLYLIFQAAVQNDKFVELISSKTYEASYTDADGAAVKQKWSNTNGYLTGQYDEPEGVSVVGGKTGTTNAAGCCLVLYSKSADNAPLISVVLKADSKKDLYNIMTQMLSNYSN